MSLREKNVQTSGLVPYDAFWGYVRNSGISLFGFDMIIGILMPLEASLIGA